MADTNQLSEDAKAAILQAITETAPGKKGNASGLASLAYAYALTVGAAHGYLPGAPPSTSS